MKDWLIQSGCFWIISKIGLKMYPNGYGGYSTVKHTIVCGMNNLRVCIFHKSCTHYIHNRKMSVASNLCVMNRWWLVKLLYSFLFGSLPDVRRIFSIYVCTQKDTTCLKVMVSLWLFLQTADSYLDSISLTDIWSNVILSEF